METRIDKYNNKNIPTRVEKNKELYTKIYSAYDEFENYKIPIDSNEVLQIVKLLKEIQMFIKLILIKILKCMM